jgi:hypothetical protein
MRRESCKGRTVSSIDEIKEIAVLTRYATCEARGMGTISASRATRPAKFATVYAVKKG